MKNFKQGRLPFATLIILLAAALIFQSCSKDSPHTPNPFKEDKFLLSKVSGQFQDVYYWGLNNFMYNQSGNFLETYSYGNESFYDIRPIQQIGFVNTGTWDFTYNHNFPDETIDHSAPGIDQGYWKYYYNKKGLIEKTGLAFNTTAQPTQFEFYTYDKDDNLTSLIYGTAVDTPFFKVNYYYDRWRNMDSFNYYFPLGYVNSATMATIKSGGKPASLSTLKANGFFAENKIAAIKKEFENNAVSAKNLPSAAGDSNVIYSLELAVKITTDNNPNPFSQQAKILFYQTNRFYTFNLLDYYMPLLKHNPVQVTYALGPDWGTSVATDLFTYTYNKAGYPDSLHQERNDPDFLEYYNYTQDKKIEYIKN